MPPRRRVPPDEIPVDVYVRVVVSETRWRAAMRTKGIDITEASTGAHVGRFLRDAVLAMIDQLQVAPPTTKKTRTIHDHRL